MLATQSTIKALNSGIEAIGENFLLILSMDLKNINAAMKLIIGDTIMKAKTCKVKALEMPVQKTKKAAMQSVG